MVPRAKPHLTSIYLPLWSRW